MLHNEKSNDDDHLNLQEGGGLTKQTLTDRKRDSNFVKYFEENKDTDVGLGELVNTEKLAVKGCADTDHKEEIPAKTLEKIYELLWNVKEALEMRGDENYTIKYLSKIPTTLHSSLHRVLQWGAALLLVFYEVRRGKENLHSMKAVDFKETADEQFEFRYIKKYRSEKDKNHKKGTNVASSGVIPYAIVEANGNIFNPGEFFSFYLSLLPKNSTLEGKEGGWLFPRPRANTKVFNVHKEGEIMFEPNQKGIDLLDNFFIISLILVGANTLAAMLPLLCSAVNSERCTNHQIRCYYHS